jgi:hypothetical protein
MATPWPSALLLALAIAAGPGCAHRVLVGSDPMGAQVRRGDETIGATPTEIVIWSIPFSRPELWLTMPGYRPMVVQLHKDKKPARRFWEFVTFRYKRAFAQVPSAHHQVILVPVHGPAGTWTSEDVPD